MALESQNTSNGEQGAASQKQPSRSFLDIQAPSSSKTCRGAPGRRGNLDDAGVNIRVFAAGHGGDMIHVDAQGHPCGLGKLKLRI